MPSSRNALLEIMDDRYRKYSDGRGQSAANGRVVRELGDNTPGRCDPGPADAQRSPAVTEGESMRRRSGIDPI